MAADFSYRPVAQAPGPSAFLEGTEIVPLDRSWPQPISVQQGLQDFYATRQNVRADKAAADAERLRSATIRAAGPGANQFDIADLEEYRQRFGSLPLDPVSGQVDLAQVRQRLTQQKQIEAALAIQTQMTKAGGAAGTMKPEDVIKMKDKERQLNDALRSGETMMKMMEENKRNVVGPGVGRLGWAFQLGTVLGVPGAKERMTDQRVLEQEISKDILRGAENMKGQLSDRDVAFLKASVPKLTDPEEVWIKYLNLRNDLIRQAQQGLAAGVAQMGNLVPDQTIQSTLAERGLPQEQIDQVLNGQDVVGSSAASTSKSTGVHRIGGKLMIADPVTGAMRPATQSELVARQPRFSNPASTSPNSPPPSPYANSFNLQGVTIPAPPLIPAAQPNVRLR